MISSFKARKLCYRPPVRNSPRSRRFSSATSVGIQTGRNGGTALEGGGGITGKLARNVSVYGDASYLTSVSGESRITLKGNVGARVTW